MLDIKLNGFSQGLIKKGKAGEHLLGLWCLVFGFTCYSVYLITLVEDLLLRLYHALGQEERMLSMYGVRQMVQKIRRENISLNLLLPLALFNS